MSASKHEQPLAALLRGCEHTYTTEELADRLASGKRLRVKLGLDPTAPDLTLGHTVVRDSPHPRRAMPDVWPQGAHVRGGAAAALPRAEEA